MIRNVLDANVLASGFIGRVGASARLIELWQADRYELVVSDHLLGELARTYEDPYFRRRITREAAERVVTLLRARALVTDLTVTVSGVATQPKDDLVFSAALSAKAEILATRDKQLLKLDGFRGLRIIHPGDFLELLLPHDEP